MGDFISNNPDGKSDLHKFAPSAEPHTPSAAPVEEPPKTQQPTEASATQQPAAEPTAQSAAQPIQGQYQNPYQNPNPNQYQNQYQNQYRAPHQYQEPYQYAVYGAPPPTKSPKDGYNIASLVLGIVSWAGLILCCGCFSPFTAIISIILAFVGRENGKFNGKAVAGIILSVSFLVIFPLLFIFFLYVAEVEPSDSSEDLVQMMIAFISNHH